MSTGKHHFIELADDGKFAVRASDSERASAVLDTQAQAVARTKEFSPDDSPNISRVRYTGQGKPDQ